MYSQELKDLVKMMLVKEEKKRPMVIDILRMPFVKKHMFDFVQHQGKVNVNPQLTTKPEIRPAVFEKILNKDQSELTAREKMKLAKEQRARQEFE